MALPSDSPRNDAPWEWGSRKENRAVETMSEQGPSKAARPNTVRQKTVREKRGCSRQGSGKEAAEAIPVKNKAAKKRADKN